MGIKLEEERTPGLPVVKRTELAQKFVGAVVKVQQRDRMKKDDNGVMVPMTHPDGRHKQELVVTCMTLPGTTAPVKLGDDEHVPEPEELVRLILKGKSFGDWIEQKRDVLDRSVEVGDIVSQVTKTAQVYDQNGKPTGDPITDQAKLNAVPRGKTVGIYGPIELRAPKANSPWIAKAEAAFHSLHQSIAAEEPADDDDLQDDEPPF